MPSIGTVVGEAERDEELESCGVGGWGGATFGKIGDSGRAGGGDGGGDGSAQASRLGDGRDGGGEGGGDGGTRDVGKQFLNCATAPRERSPKTYPSWPVVRPADCFHVRVVGI